MANQSVEHEINSLYQQHPRDFVRARNGLARELKEAGDTEAAKRVRKRRKPTLAAFALNVVAGDEADRISELRDAGAAVRQAQEQALAGDDSDLRSADDRRRQLIRELTDIAVGHAGEGQRDRIEATFEAASVDDAIGEELSSARMTKPRDRPAGLGDLTTMLSSSTRRPRRDRKVIKDLERKIDKLEQTLERQRSERDRANDRLTDARKAADAAQRRVDQAEQTLGRIRADLGRKEG